MSYALVIKPNSEFHATAGAEAYDVPQLLPVEDHPSHVRVTVPTALCMSS
jgi:hypothetical protein